MGTQGSFSLSHARDKTEKRLFFITLPRSKLTVFLKMTVVIDSNGNRGLTVDMSACVSQWNLKGCFRKRFRIESFLYVSLEKMFG